jgi:phosphoglycolate phosphatase-like HAD superfamily hydrolase
MSQMNLAIFDIDGTLTNTNAIDAQCYVRAVHAEFGIDVTGLDWADYTFVTDIGITDQMFQERLGRRPTADEIARLQRRLVTFLEEAVAAAPDAFAEIPGAGAALAWLRRHPDWAVAIATGCWQVSARLKLRSAGISAEDLPSAFCEDGHSREDVVRTAHARALAQHGAEGFERVVSIGDGIWDLTTARRLSLPFVGVCAHGDGSLHRGGATHVMRDLSDVDELLRCLQDADVPGDGGPGA